MSRNGYESIDLYLADFDRRDHLLYRLVIVGILLASLAAPFVQIDTSLRSAGTIRPLVENLDVRAPVQGFVTQIAAEEGQPITLGQAILVIEELGSKGRSTLNTARVREMERHLIDLQMLLEGDSSQSSSSVTTSKYQESVRRYENEMQAVKARQARARRDHIRAQALFSTDLISQTELEIFEAGLQESYLEVEKLRKDYRRRWMEELEEYSSELLDRRLYATELSADKHRGIVRAPAAGTIENLADLEIGSFIGTGEVLASISLTSELVGELFLEPSEIPQIALGTGIKVQINSMDYQDWGLVSGTILKISPDVISVNQNRVFRVITSLEQSSRKDGESLRPLRKGMTFKAHVNGSERNVLQLARDRLRDWLTTAIE